MPDQLHPPDVHAIDHAQEDAEGLRLLSRSPHPYHHQSFELQHPSDSLSARAESIPAAAPKKPGVVVVEHPRAGQLLPAFRSLSKESISTSDSGTEADDEHLLKGLPAPRVRLHKGLRGQSEALSGSSTPLLSPAVLEEEGRGSIPKTLRRDVFETSRRSHADKSRLRKELLRRSTELFILVSLAQIVCASSGVRPLVRLWRKGKTAVFCVREWSSWC